MSFDDPLNFSGNTDVVSEPAVSQSDFTNVGNASIQESENPGFLDQFQSVGLSALNAGISGLAQVGVATAATAGKNLTASANAILPTTNPLGGLLAGFTNPFANILASVKNYISIIIFAVVALVLFLVLRK